MAYLELTAGEMIGALRDDGMKWAEAFHERFPAVPVDQAFGWFANAIEASSDFRQNRLLRSDARWAEFLAESERTRALYRDLGLMNPEEATK